MPSTDASSPTEPILGNADGQYEEYTKQASTVLRSLLIAAIGVVWLFAGGLTSQPKSPQETFGLVSESRALSAALWFAVAGLALDILQYVIGALSWGLYRWIWREILRNDSYETPLAQSPKTVRFSWRLARTLKITQYIRSHRSDARPLPTAAERLGFEEDTADARKALELQEVSKALGSDWSPPFMNRLTSGIFLLKVVSGVATYVALLIAVS